MPLFNVETKMAATLRFKVSDLHDFVCKLSLVADSFDCFTILYSAQCEMPLKFEKYELIAGIGKKHFWQGTHNESIPEEVLRVADNELLLGHISYEYGRRFYDFSEQTPLPIQLPDFYWFQPEFLITLRKGETEVEINGTNVEKLLRLINLQEISVPPIIKTQFIPTLSKNDYIQQVKQIKEDIAAGDYYELNFCQMFSAENFSTHPLSVWFELLKYQKVPFAALLKLDSTYVVSASPERFLMKSGTKLISQPIKGTQKRGRNESEDLALKEALLADPKERAENVMIVDLVRNDLSQFCETGSVEVNELCGLYSYPSVHQLISTVSGTLQKEVDLNEILRRTFPMGSMTGAPKQMVITRCGNYEPIERGLYSGSVGYMGPNGDFDLNVVIRSLVIDVKKKKAHYHVGGAITIDSIEEMEYQECVLKASFWQKLFHIL